MKSASDTWTYCFLIPVYNHAALLKNTIPQFLQFGIPLIIVDDGSNKENKIILKRIVDAHPAIALISNIQNSGKGFAIKQGIEYCKRHTIDFAFQVDADNQHSLAAVPEFLNRSKAQKSIKHSIIGYPIYDDTVPTIRKDARKISNFFVSVTTLTPDVRDSLCGFRIYPVAETWKIYRNPFISKRMPIDMELLTRLYWNGVSIIYMPVNVTYPTNGSSHYKAFRDTVILSAKHAFLCCEMFFRFPLILFYALRRLLHS
ncbi:glycosyltransferase family 2 protein [Treponema vincentii]|uniref:glycosyltransferase family 2 protein n=1 Tax=Treponema vincentii TaxID=69710 RepID=UPI0035F57141